LSEHLLNDLLSQVVQVFKGDVPFTSVVAVRFALLEDVFHAPQHGFFDSLQVQAFERRPVVPRVLVGALLLLTDLGAFLRLLHDLRYALLE
jgi:hypothetical protein